ncbi:MAG TPA: Flp family type IVb pilin [Planctomycetaceae bacterium]|nr:Flp family type IVb pilin [Planctomycetaceae bacterium]
MRKSRLPNRFASQRETTVFSEIHWRLDLHSCARRSTSTDATNQSVAKNQRENTEPLDGPTAVEYAVMLALIIVVCLTAIQAVGTNANAKFNTVKNALT